jgi:hypothetical protein
LFPIFAIKCYHLLFQTEHGTYNCNTEQLHQRWQAVAVYLAMLVLLVSTNMLELEAACDMAGGVAVIARWFLLYHLLDTRFQMLFFAHLLLFSISEFPGIIEKVS